MMFGLLSETAMSSMRPPMLAGPTERKRNDARSGSVETLIVGGATRAAACADIAESAYHKAANGTVRRANRRNAILMRLVLVGVARRGRRTLQRRSTTTAPPFITQRTRCT